MMSVKNEDAAAVGGEDGSEWVAVALGESEDPIEIPTEADRTLLLTSITAQFPGTTGLKFRNESTGSIRGIRCQENVLFPPSKAGWGTVRYICVRPQVEEKKRKVETELAEVPISNKTQKTTHEEASESKAKEDSQTTDLIILGLPFKSTEDEVKTFFETFGEVMMVQLKKKPNGQSRGFGFLRFVDKKVQEKVMLTRHLIADRWCDVKLPDSQYLNPQAPIKKKEDTCKIFVARISESIKENDIRQHFEEFGVVTDVFYPEPFRGFAFVTFVESKVAQSLIGKEHIIKGISVHIGLATPKNKIKPSREDMRGGYGGGRNAYVGFSGDPWMSGGGNSFQENRGFYQ